MLRRPAAWVPFTERRDDAAAVAVAARWVREQHELRAGPAPVLITRPGADVPNDPLLAAFTRRHAPSVGLPEAQSDLHGLLILAFEPDRASLSVCAQAAYQTGTALCVIEGRKFHVRDWAAEAEAIDLSRSEHPRLTEALQHLCNTCDKKQERALLIDLRERNLLNGEEILHKCLARGMPAVKVLLMRNVIDDLPWLSDPELP